MKTKGLQNSLVTSLTFIKSSYLLGRSDGRIEVLSPT